MSKDIIIKHDGVAQELDAADTVRVKGVTQSRVDFVPEDECTVKGKFIAENGTYTAANDGAIGYKKVAVMDVASVGADETVSGATSVKVAITEGGTARAISKVKKLQVNAQGGGNVLLLPKPNLKSTTLHVTKPGLYDVKDEADADVYSSVTVNVSDADRDAAGFNPSNPTWQDNLPDKIRVTTPPNKTTYSEGEQIDYTGMVVTAYKNGQVWSNPHYPGGVIPFEELILKTGIASISAELQIDLEDLREWFKANFNLSDVDYDYLCAITCTLQKSVKSKTVASYFNDTFIYFPEIEYSSNNYEKTLTVEFSTVDEYPMAVYRRELILNGNAFNWPAIITPSNDILVTRTMKYTVYENKTAYQDIPLAVIGEVIRDEPDIHYLSTDPYYGTVIECFQKVAKIQRSGGGRTGKREPSTISPGDYNHPPKTIEHNFANENSPRIGYATNPVVYTLPDSQYTLGVNDYIGWVIQYGGRLNNVSWKRPGDGEVLSTTYRITIAQ